MNTAFSKSRGMISHCIVLLTGINNVKRRHEPSLSVKGIVDDHQRAVELFTGTAVLQKRYDVCIGFSRVLPVWQPSVLSVPV